ncbi:tryptophan halogenase family protein [Sphingomonas bacterium]|uniref:tryptophan halogenase family protein n=1 Tax=Sphingomonas bacterium TaxID=1895847 RepID=UPI001577264D|nr:tryptophan halogenase family protein [Sphingomonas bacterium]
MPRVREILIVGGGTAGWLAAAYLAKALGGSVRVTLLESSEIGIIGVGEGTFPTIRDTLRFIGVEETDLVREASATFKQGVRFTGWQSSAGEGSPHSYLHPFEPPFHGEGTGLIPYWLRQDELTRPSFADAMTLQSRVAAARRAPKQPGDGDFTGPLAYAFHFDAARFVGLVADRARALGVKHLSGQVRAVETDERGWIAGVSTDEGTLTADLFVDCTGFRAELIGRTLASPFHSVAGRLFTDRALTCKLPYDTPDAPIESYTVATAHEAGWIWDIGLAGARGVGCVYASRYIDDDRAAAILADYLGSAAGSVTPRRLAFEPGWRERPWIGNCVAVGLAGGFLEPLESTGTVLIEAAVGIIAELFPRQGPIDLSAARFNELMSARYATIVNFLKLHYCLSRRPEPFWRDNADPATVPERLRDLIDQWRWRPPSRFDFQLDVESFAYFNYQYILYGMDFRTELAEGAGDFPHAAEADRQFSRIRAFGERAARDLPSHRALVDALSAVGSLSPARTGS